MPILETSTRGTAGFLAVMKGGGYQGKLTSFRFSQPFQPACLAPVLTCKLVFSTVILRQATL